MLAFREEEVVAVVTLDDMCWDTIGWSLGADGPLTPRNGAVFRHVPESVQSLIHRHVDALGDRGSARHREAAHEIMKSVVCARARRSSTSNVQGVPDFCGSEWWREVIPHAQRISQTVSDQIAQHAADAWSDPRFSFDLEVRYDDYHFVVTATSALQGLKGKGGRVLQGLRILLIRHPTRRLLTEMGMTGDLSYLRVDGSPHTTCLGAVERFVNPNCRDGETNVTCWTEAKARVIRPGELGSSPVILLRGAKALPAGSRLFTCRGTDERCFSDQHDHPGVHRTFPVPSRNLDPTSDEPRYDVHRNPAASVPPRDRTASPPPLSLPLLPAGGATDEDLDAFVGLSADQPIIFDDPSPAPEEDTKPDISSRSRSHPRRHRHSPSPPRPSKRTRRASPAAAPTTALADFAAALEHARRRYDAEEADRARLAQQRRIWELEQELERYKLIRREGQSRALEED